MFGLLALLFVVVPIVELYVIVQVAGELGVLATIVLVMVVSAAGAWLCKREGLSLFRRIQGEVGAGRVPTTSLVDGFLVLFAGALLLTPGFVTDALGLLLLLPPFRVGVRALLVRRFARRARLAAEQQLAGGVPGGFPRVFVYGGRIGARRGAGPRRGPGPGGPAGPPVIDVEEAGYLRPGPDRPADGDGRPPSRPPR